MKIPKQDVLVSWFVQDNRGSNNNTVSINSVNDAIIGIYTKAKESALVMLSPPPPPIRWVFRNDSNPTSQLLRDHIDTSNPRREKREPSTTNRVKISFSHINNNNRHPWQHTSTNRNNVVQKDGKVYLLSSVSNTTRSNQSQHIMNGTIVRRLNDTTVKGSAISPKCVVLTRLWCVDNGCETTRGCGGRSPSLFNTTITQRL